MFLHMCVCPGHGGDLVQGVPGPRGAPGGDPLPGTATAVGGMHPTGMHSCLIVS